MSYRVCSYGGSWKTCPECGKLFFVNDAEAWVYKRSAVVDGESRVRHFCKWSCMLKFDKRYEEEKQKNRSESAKRAHERNRKPRRLCFECLYNCIDEDGKHFCWIGSSKYVFPKKDACKKFESREEQDSGDS